MKKTIQTFPVLQAPSGWLPVVLSACLAAAGFLVAAATAADLIGWGQ